VKTSTETWLWKREDTIMVIVRKILLGRERRTQQEDGVEWRFILAVDFALNALIFEENSAKFADFTTIN
jgi:hypothetical protein